LVGLRAAFRVPAELRASWLFRSVPIRDPSEALSGVRKAMVLIGLLPCCVASAAVCAQAWIDPARVILSYLFDVAAGLLLVELLLLRFRSVPFASTYVPGKANLKVTLIPWALAFALYTRGMAALELRLLADPSGMAAFLIGAGVSIAALRGAAARSV